MYNRKWTSSCSHLRSRSRVQSNSEQNQQQQHLHLSGLRRGAELHVAQHGCALLGSTGLKAVLLLSSIREPHHKLLLEKLNESLNRPGSRLAALTLLGHLVRKQPPWVHHISRSALLQSLLRCLKTDGDVVVLITAVLVLITLLPMIPQAGKQHIYDFFDVFGRLASWSYRNPSHVPMVHLVHLHAELVTGTQDYELDPSRWRCYEVHDIVIECSRVSLDPLEASCEEDLYSSLRDPPSSSSSSSPRPPRLSSPLPVLDLTPGPHSTESICSSGNSVSPSPSGRLTLPQLTFNTCCSHADDVTWSPSSQCGLSTPPPEPAATGSAHSLSRTTSISGVKCPSPASVPAPYPEEIQDGGQSPVNNSGQVKQQPIIDLEGVSSMQPITEREERAQSDVISNCEGEDDDGLFTPGLFTPGLFTPGCPCLQVSCQRRPTCPPLLLLHSWSSPLRSEEEGPGLFDPDRCPASPYEPLFDLALPHAATLFVGRKTQEVLQRAVGQQEGGGGVEGEDREEGQTPVSPLEVLDQLIIHGHKAHEHLSRRLSAVSKSVDRSHFGGKQQSMKTKGPALGEELQCLRSQLLLIHSQLQYERFKRQQHAVRNRRLLRRVINATALEEQSVAMKGQLEVQDQELRSLRLSLDEEQRRYTELQQDTHTHTHQLHTHIQQLLLQHQDEQRDNQRLQSELQECQSRLRDLEAELQKANNKAYNAEHQLTELSLKEASMLQCSVGKEYQRLKDSELSACESRCVALRRVTQNLQTEMLHLYSQIHLDTPTHSSCPQDVCNRVSEPPTWKPEPAPPGTAPSGLAPPADLTLAVRRRRHELSIMDYDEMLPEY
ncbi:hypothetical protein INR49_023211 [Caranx melampygus]|nr:hypothetical protein INR49_023211 [Caranx melampygus]